jgi:hypothetical protein
MAVGGQVGGNDVGQVRVRYRIAEHAQSVPLRGQIVVVDHRLNVRIGAGNPQRAERLGGQLCWLVGRVMLGQLSSGGRPSTIRWQITPSWRA